MHSPDTTVSLISNIAEKVPTAPALWAPEREPLSYAELFGLIERTGNALQSFGIKRSDPVVIALPNGPETATCILAVSSVAISAPLSVAYSAHDCELYLSEIRPKALIVESKDDSPLVSVANSRGIPVLRLRPLYDQPAGIFCFGQEVDGKQCDTDYSQTHEIALLLHTSGSSSRPKMVPLIHGNLCRSARNIRDSLALTSSDKCLNIMPLVHGHGLIGAVFTSIATGA